MEEVEEGYDGVSSGEVVHDHERVAMAVADVSVVSNPVSRTEAVLAHYEHIAHSHRHEVVEEADSMHSSSDIVALGPSGEPTAQEYRAIAALQLFLPHYESAAAYEPSYLDHSTLSRSLNGHRAISIPYIQDEEQNSHHNAAAASYYTPAFQPMLSMLPHAPMHDSSSMHSSIKDILHPIIEGSDSSNHSDSLASVISVSSSATNSVASIVSSSRDPQDVPTVTHTSSRSAHEDWDDEDDSQHFMNSIAAHQHRLNHSHHHLNGHLLPHVHDEDDKADLLLRHGPSPLTHVESHHTHRHEHENMVIAEVNATHASETMPEMDEHSAVSPCPQSPIILPYANGPDMKQLLELRKAASTPNKTKRATAIRKRVKPPTLPTDATTSSSTSSRTSSRSVETPSKTNAKRTAASNISPASRPLSSSVSSTSTANSETFATPKLKPGATSPGCSAASSPASETSSTASTATTPSDVSGSPYTSPVMSIELVDVRGVLMEVNSKQAKQMRKRLNFPSRPSSFSDSSTPYKSRATAANKRSRSGGKFLKEK